MTRDSTLTRKRPTSSCLLTSTAVLMIYWITLTSIPTTSILGLLIQPAESFTIPTIPPPIAPSRKRWLSSRGTTAASTAIGLWDSTTPTSTTTRLFTQTDEEVETTQTTTTTALRDTKQIDSPETPTDVVAVEQLNDALITGDLKEMVRVLEQHTFREFTREQWDLMFEAIEERTAQAEENDIVNIRQQQQRSIQGGGPGGPTVASGTRTGEFPLESKARSEMTKLYQLLHDQGHLRLYGATSTKNAGTTPIPNASLSSSSSASALSTGGSVSIAPPSQELDPSTTKLPITGTTHTVSPQLLERILDIPMSALTPQPTNVVLYAGAIVAVLEALVSMSTGISLNLLALLTIFIATIDRLFLNGAVLEGFLKILSPGTQSKIVKHEAGHFLMAYLLGCPVEGIVLSAWGALQDTRFSTRRVSAGTSFFDPELSYQMNTSRKITRDSIDRYSIIVMAGIAAEADSYGKADGGASDELALITFLSQLNGGRTTGTNAVTWDYETIRNQARWGAMQSIMIIRQYKPAYDALVDALERGGKLGDCIFAIEKAARDHNLQPLTQPLGYLSIDTTTREPVFTNATSLVLPTNGVAATTGSVEGTKSNTLLNGESSSVLQGSNAPGSSTTMASGSTNTAIPIKENEKSPEEQLKEYREQVEAKLRSIEERLKEIES